MRISLLNLNLIGPDAVGSTIVNTTRFLLRRGDDVRIYIGAPPRDVPEDVARLCRVVTMADLLRGRAAGNGDVENLFFRLSDLAIYHYPIYYDLLESIHGRDRGAVIFDYHCVTPASMATSALERELLVRGHAESSHAHAADLVVVHSAFAADELAREHGVPPERMRVLPFHADPAIFSPGPRDEALAERYGLRGRRVIAYVGRMAASKDVEALVRVLARVQAPDRAVSLLLVGDDRTSPVYLETVARVKTLAESLGLSRDVVFTGPVADLASHYRLADVFVTASRHEGFCIPVVEAMACGVPVVSSDAGALPDTVGEAGVVVPAGDCEAMASAVARLLTVESERSAKVATGLERARQMTPVRFEERLAAIIDDAMRSAGRVSRLVAESPAIARTSVAVFGTGAAAFRAFQAERQAGRDVVAFIDNDEVARSQPFLGKPVIEPARLVAMPDADVVVAGNHRADMARQLADLGVPERRIRVVEPPKPIPLARLAAHGVGIQKAIDRLAGGSTRRRVVIFGAGAGGVNAFDALRRRDEVLAFADNDPKKHGTELLGRPVLSAKQAVALRADRVVIASIHARAIRGQLQELGLESSRVEVFGGQ